MTTPSSPPTTTAATGTATDLPRTALITGASRGLGRALARILALDHGVEVALVARSAGPLHELVDELRTAGARAHAIVADGGDKRAIHAIAGQAAAALGDIDLLVNNASMLGPDGPPGPLRLLLDSECEDFEAVLQTNLLGPFRLTKAVAGAMALRGRGTVIDVSSDAAVEAYPTWGPYGVSKAALDHLTRIWAAELADSGVKLLAIDPGEMDTRMHAEAMPDADRSALARPEDVAATILDMLRSPRVETGARLSVPAWSAEARRAS